MKKIGVRFSYVPGAATGAVVICHHAPRVERESRLCLALLIGTFEMGDPLYSSPWSHSWRYFELAAFTLSKEKV